MFRLLENTLKGFPEFGDLSTVIYFYDDGATMRKVYRFTEIKAKIKADDMVNPEIHLFNSYDTVWPFILMLGTSLIGLAGLRRKFKNSQLQSLLLGIVLGIKKGLERINL